RSLGAQCSTSQPVNADQCKDSNAGCTFSGSDYRCSCNDRFHQEGSVCVADKALGESCNNANECSDPNAGCLANKCTCDGQHYQYKPSSNANNVCEKVEQLQVTGISFSNIQTTQFTVFWTPPAGKDSYISGYMVEWRPTNNNVGGDSRNVSSASPQTLTGLTPGRTYEVKVISKNTATQPGSTRSTSSKKNQATEPSKPGTVTSTLNDLDAWDNMITIRWVTSFGVATQYRVKLIDGSTEVTSTTSTLRTAVISHSTLKDGHTYTVHIEARSQAYDGNYLWSEKRISTIKTKVQVPDPPRYGICKDPTDKSITLEWSKPADTKGDLVKYHIHVYQDFNTVKFIVSTTGTQNTVGNLDPALHKSNLRLSPSKTVVAPTSTTILDWTWSNGIITANAHRNSVLPSCPPPTAKYPTTLNEQSTTPPPEVVGISFAADVVKRNKQLILVLRGTVSSCTAACKIENEKHDALQNAMLKPILGLHPLECPYAVIRCDASPGFVALRDDETLKSLRIVLEFGCMKNANKNPVAEILEFENELLRHDPSGGPFQNWVFQLLSQD
ncbi:uncharacterized protein LOC128552638, partial [Mercenaria mercenaria]|uniref:uncharacterized protein LOC128552638 n=1 Tax=Mercenaria mercenaria TaxID=6596 RepID=UPI00234EF92D